VRDAHLAHNRARIAELAARFIAEHGISDYALAKRKAARSLGLPDGHGLPSNDEIDAALVYRQSLYEPEEQAALLLALRQQALAVMQVFEHFSPSLTGAVASGAVSDHSLIELDIAMDSSKDFEQFLINRNIEFKVRDKAGRMAYLIYSEPADVLVRINPGEAHHGNSAPRSRLDLRQLQKLMPAASAGSKTSASYNPEH
jgi:hypothetical protein